MVERNYWLAFNHLVGVGASRFRRLLKHFGTLELAWNANPQDLLDAGLPEKIVNAQHDLRKTLNIAALQDELEQKHIKAFTWLDESYPFLLAQINQPPPVLYYRGSFLPADQKAVAIVGTRQMSAYGRQLTHDTAFYLAANNVTVVSGLARGVDAVAHLASLEAGGRTLAVLGSGLDVIYPPEHRKMAEMIAESGAIISDYPPGTPPEGINFPPRNRIISGLSLATLVIEAGDRSGALITAKFAADQGREVFAVPGSVLSPVSKGTNRLIANGAIPMTNPADLLQALKIPTKTSQPDTEDPVLNERESRILKVLANDSVHIDELAARLDLAIETLSAELILMELKGLVQRDNGMEYSAIHKWQIG